MLWYYTTTSLVYYINLLRKDSQYACEYVVLIEKESNHVFDHPKGPRGGPRGSGRTQKFFSVSNSLFVTQAALNRVPTLRGFFVSKNHVLYPLGVTPWDDHGGQGWPKKFFSVSDSWFVTQAAPNRAPTLWGFFDSKNHAFDHPGGPLGGTLGVREDPKIFFSVKFVICDSSSTI